MLITPKNYEEMYKKASPKSPIFKNCLLAFISGGIICAIGQAISSLFTNVIGLSLNEAQVWVSVTLIGLGSFLTAINVYDNIAKFSGAGTIVPITGFANSIVAPAMEFKKEGHVLGTGSKMFTIAGPVIVFGVISSIVYGLIIWFFGIK
ncbi:MAG: stage V sporulation protein AC [Firmicutes bacterium]|nr:stage V sporulation protein AC [Bacillota bacterium]